MAKEVLMPKLGMTMEKGTITQWIATEGDEISAGDLLLEVMTDKINIEVEAYESGTLLKVYYEEGDDVPVNQVIAYIGEKGEHVPDQPPSSEEESPVSSKTEEETTETSTVFAKVESVKPRATPAARKMAREHDFDLTQISGSGKRGRIHVEDVRQYHANIQTPVVPVVKQNTASSIKVSGIRKTIGKRMLQSSQEIPHVTLHTEADMGEVVHLRNALLPNIEKSTGLRLSYTEVILKAVASSLRHHPLLRSSLHGNEIITHEQINLGLAVSQPDGLVVPVIHQVDQLGLEELTKKVKQVAHEAREGRISPDLLTGGVFTVSNLGMYRVDQFNPIINQPEGAILGTGRIYEKPVARKGEMVLRHMMSLSLSFDHRILDGAPAAAFLTELVERLENPYQLLM